MNIRKYLTRAFVLPALTIAGAVCLACLLAERATAAGITWSGANSATDLNWSDNNNWNAVGPPSGDTVVFNNTGGTGTTSIPTTSIVDQSFTISSLTFTNTGTSTNSYQNLVIGSTGSGTTLTVNGAGGLTFGLTSTSNTNLQTNVNISGTGALTVNNASANFVLGLTTSTANGFNDTVNMSGLSSFTFSGSNFDVGAWTGSGGSRQTGGVLNLASTSSITASATIDVGDNGNATNTSNITSVLNLGTGTNTIDTNMFNVGRTKAAGSVAFYPTAGSAAGVTIRGSAGGSSRVTTISIGDHLAAASTNASGTMDFSLGQVNAMIGTLYIATCDNTGSTGDGTGTFIMGPNPNSVVDVTTMNLATVGSGRTTATVKIEGGTFAFGTIPAALGTATVSFSGGSTICSNTASSTETPAFNLGTSGTSSTVTFGNPGLGYTGSMTFNGAATLLGSTTLQVNAPTTLAGVIGDNSSGYGLTLSGTGQLALNSVNTYSGGTTIHSGTLALGASGTIGASGLSINPGGAWDVSAYGPSGYNFTGSVLTAGRTAAQGIDINGSLNVTGATLAQPGPNSMITISGSLSLTSDTINYYSGDKIALVGSGALSQGGGDYVNLLSPIGTGTYTLFTGSSVPANPASYLTMTGDLSSRQNYVFNVSAGTAVTLTVSGAPGNLRWSGGSNQTWDTGSSQSWYNLSASAADYFFAGDNVTFNDTPGSATNVNISGTVQPGSITVSNTSANYTFGGGGSIAGVAALVKNGPGSLTINTGNSYSGGALLNGGLLNLGNATALGSGPLTISGGSLDNISGSPITLSGAPVNLNSSFTFVGSYPLNTGTGAVTLGAAPTVNVSGGTLTVGGSVSGPYGLTMTGAGMMVLAASNNYTGSTSLSQGTLQLGAAGAIPTGAGTGNVLFTNAGASSVLDLNGNNATVNGLSQPNASTTNMVVNNLSGGTATLSVGNNNATCTFAGVLADNNTGNGGALALTKIGTGTLTLAGMNTYSGPTTVNGGTLALAPATTLPSATTLNFSGDGTFSMGANNQAIAGLTTSPAVINSFTGAVTGVNGLTVNAASSMLIGGANPNQSATLVLAGLPAFAYNGPGYTFDAGNQYIGVVAGTGPSSNGAGTVWLAASNTITANVFGVASNGSEAEQTTNVSTGLVYLGQTNTINATNVEVAYNNQRSSVTGTLEFAPGSVNPTLALFGVSGAGSRAEVTVGSIGFSFYSQYATGTIDLVTGVTGASVLTGYVDQMILGGHNYANNPNPASGIFNMGGGTLDANTILLGDLSASEYGSASATGTFSLNGGTVLAGQINLGVIAAGTPGGASGTFNLNSGLVSASMIASGTGSNTFNWSSGTITNYNPIYGLGGDASEGNLVVSGPTLALASAGTHTFWIDLGYTGSISSTITGAGVLTVNGPGTLVLAASNTYSGGTTLSTGSLQMGAVGALGTGSLTISSGTLDLNGYNTAVGSLSGPSGLITDNSPATGTTTLTVNQTTNTSFGGTLQDGANGTFVGLTFNGPGTSLKLAAANHYSGPTTITVGTLALGPAGTLGSGNLAINPGGVWDVSAYGAPGYTFSGGVLTAGRTASPATDINGTLNVQNASLYVANGSAGTMTISGGLGLSGGTLNYAVGDLVAVGGALTFGGTDYVAPLALLTAGNYKLFTYSGAAPNTADLAVGGGYGASPRFHFSFAAGGGAVTLSVSGAPANLRWFGGANSSWDTATSKNWYNLATSAADYFYIADNVIFNDTPGTATNVNISGTVQPGNVTVSNTNANYTFTGTGSIGGLTSLVKNGPGSLTIATSNSYTGGTVLNGGVLNDAAANSLGGGSLAISGGTANLNNAQTIASATLGAGLLNLGNQAALGSGPLTLSGGSLDNTSGLPITLSASALNLNGGFTFVGSNPLNTGSGAVTLGGNSTVTVSNGTLTVGATISGSGGLTTTGTGMTILAASNSYTGNTDIAQGTLQLGATGAIPTGAGTGNVVFTAAGASAVLDLNGINTTVNGLSQPTASSTNVVVNNLAGAGLVTLSVGNNNATSTFGGVLADNNNGNGNGDTLALTKIGTGALTLGGANTYSGPTTITGGTLALAAGGSLSGATTVSFSGNGTLSVGPNSQAVVGLAVADSFTGTVTGVGSLTVNATGSMLIGGANPNQTQTLVMSSLGAFSYNGPGYTFNVGGEYTGTTSTSNGAGTVWLAGSNSITANVFGVASNGSEDEVTTNVSTGLVYLGQSNAINSATIEVADNGNTNQRTSTAGTLQFAPGSVNPTLTIYGAGGAGNRTEVTVGNTGNTSYSQYATGTIDLVTGVTGNSVLTAYVDQMILGYHNWYNNGHPASGTFNMGGGTLDANSIIVGDFTGGTVSGGNATGTFSLNGGTVLAGQITLGVVAAGTSGAASGTFNLNSGLLSASTISSGSGSAAFNWSGGTIANYDPIYGLGGDAPESGLTISIPAIALAATGMHTFWIDASQAGAVSSNISGSGAIASTGAGTLTLSGTDSTFSGGLYVSNGTVILTNNEAVADGESLAVGNASLFSPIDPAEGIAPAGHANATPVPEPGTLTMLAAGAVVAGWCVRRQARRRRRR
jgi:fibronectin-binding autotransporter adhesin